MNWKVHAVYALVILVLLVLGGIAWRSSMDSAKSLQDMETTFKNMDQRLKQSQDAMDQRAKDTKVQLDSMQERINNVKSPGQAALELARLIPGLKPTIVAVPSAPSNQTPTVASEGQPARLESSNSGRTTVTQPAQGEQYCYSGDQLMAIYKSQAECEKIKVQLAQLESDRQTLLDQREALQQKVDAAANAAKGGTRWQRFRKAGKIVACAAVGGGAGAVIGNTRGQSSVGGAVGALAGAGLCAAF